MEKFIVGHIGKVSTDDPADSAVADNQYIFLRIILFYIFNESIDPVRHLHHGFSALRIPIGKLALVGKEAFIFPILSFINAVVLLNETLVNLKRDMVSVCYRPCCLKSPLQG